jgi:serine protease AprX
MRQARSDAFQICNSISQAFPKLVGNSGETSTLLFLSGIWGGKLSTDSPAESQLSKRLRCSAVWGGAQPPHRTATWSRSVLLAVMVVLAFSVVGFAKPRKVAADLQSVSTGDVDVIIQFKNQPTADHFSKVQNLGGKLKHDLGGSLKAASFHVPASALQALEQMDDVAHVSLDHKLSATGTPRDFYTTAENVPNPGPGRDGGGIGVAIIDSGISGNGDMPTSGPGSTVVYSQSFVPGDYSTSDAYGHGTHVAGIVAGNGHNSSGTSAIFTFKGIAPNANLINLRVLDANGSASDSSVIAAIQRAINLKSQYNIRVINLSLGRPVFESYTVDPLCQAVEAAWQAGIVVVVAAGNMGRYPDTNGYATITAPGNDPYVITVGAMKPMGTPDRSDDLIASYSSKGPTLFDHVVKPDLVATGNRVISVLAPYSQLATRSTANLIPVNYYQNTISSLLSNYYLVLNGTSMAAPSVSGAAALMLQQNAALTPDQVKARLMKTAYKTFPASSTAIDPVTGIAYTSYYDVFTIGAGYLDIGAALANTDVAPANVGAAMSPSVQYDASTGTVSLVNGTSVCWGQSLVWGQSVVWGQTVLNGSSVVWGQSVVWGNNTLSGFSLVWGQSMVWGQSDSSGATSIAVNGEN